MVRNSGVATKPTSQGTCTTRSKGPTSSSLNAQYSGSLPEGGWHS